MTPDPTQLRMILGNRCDIEAVSIRVGDLRALIDFWEDGHEQIEEMTEAADKADNRIEQLEGEVSALREELVAADDHLAASMA